jgi:hypothetical protein
MIAAADVADVDNLLFIVMLDTRPLPLLATLGDWSTNRGPPHHKA